MTGATTEGPLGRKIMAGVGDAAGTLGGQALTGGFGWCFGWNSTWRRWGFWYDQVISTQYLAVHQAQLFQQLQRQLRLLQGLISQMQ